MSTTIPVRIRESLSASGFIMVSADKRRCVVLALKSFSDMSDRAIASHVGVDDHTVASVRIEVRKSATELAESPTEVITRKGKDGKSYKATKAPTEGVWTPPERFSWREPENKLTLDTIKKGAAILKGAHAVDEASVKFRLDVEKSFEKWLKQFKPNQREEVKSVVGTLPR